MTPPDASETPSQTPTPAESRRLTIEAAEPRNLLSLAVHHIVLRIGWIFKTESVIMPAFVDTIAGAGWLRGCLPVLNRFGQSVPPLLFADRLRRARQKKQVLIITSLLMALPFLALAAIWFALDEKRHGWLPAVFLLLYLAFFSVTGLNQLVFGTIQGKLIRPNRRGRLLSLSGTIGAVLALLCAWLLLRNWLTLPDGGFGYIFGFTGMGFVAAGLCCLPIIEPVDDEPRAHPSENRHFHAAWETFSQDTNFRRLATVSMLFVTVQLLFPHYQALGRQNLPSGGVELMVWVIAQNAGTALFSLVAGMIADNFGYRLVVRIEAFLAAATPLLAILLASGWFADGMRYYWLTFFMLGLVPVTFKTLTNYTLELADPQQHPRYISTLKLCMAIPFCLSPLVGLLVDWVGFQLVFSCIAVVIIAAGVLTFRLSEPRFESR
jgi:hypothetical protein